MRHSQSIESSSGCDDVTSTTSENSAVFSQFFDVNLADKRKFNDFFGNPSADSSQNVLFGDFEGTKYARDFFAQKSESANVQGASANVQFGLASAQAPPGGQSTFFRNVNDRRSSSTPMTEYLNDVESQRQKLFVNLDTETPRPVLGRRPQTNLLQAMKVSDIPEEDESVVAPGERLESSWMLEAFVRIRRHSTTHRPSILRASAIICRRGKSLD